MSLLQKHLFTVEEFHAMPEVFNEDDRVELIEGEIIEMAAIGNRHMFFVNQLNDILVPQVGSLATISVQNPIRLGELSELQPDLVVLSGRPRDYRNKSATVSNILLLIELEHQVVEVYRDPKTTGYAQLTTANVTDKLSPQSLTTIKVDLSELFID